MSPFLEVCIQLNVYQCTGDRAVTEPLLYLEQVSACLVIVKGMSMPQGVESITTVLPPQLLKTMDKNLGDGFLADMRALLLSREKPVI